MKFVFVALASWLPWSLHAPINGSKIMIESTAPSNDILFDQRDGIGRVTFNRPQARNAFTFAMYERLAEICEEATATVPSRCWSSRAPATRPSRPAPTSTSSADSPRRSMRSTTKAASTGCSASSRPVARRPSQPSTAPAPAAAPDRGVLRHSYRHQDDQIRISDRAHAR